MSIRQAALGSVLCLLATACGAGASPAPAGLASPVPSASPSELAVATEEANSDAAVAPTPNLTQAPDVSARPTAMPTARPPASAAPPPTPAPTAQRTPPDVPAGHYAVTVVAGLRLRSLPSVDASSERYVPLLPKDATLYVLGRPVEGSGYWWSEVQLVGRTLNGGVVRGWVPDGDHDGTSWVAHADVDPDPGLDFTVAERTLLAGVRGDIGGCAAVRSGLPTGAVAAVRCRPGEPGISSVAVTRFPTDAAALERYLAVVEERGIELRSHSGSCQPDIPSEGAYVPGDTGSTLEFTRMACFRDAAGHARFMATEGGGVLVEVAATAAHLNVPYDYAWRGNQDTPGSPTVWGGQPT